MGPIAARAHNLARVETWLTGLVQARRQEPTEGSDALSRLLAADPAYPDAFVVYQLLTLLVAGHDTTSLALSWTACQLMARPDLMARVAREVTASEDPGGADSVAEALPLTHATIRESLRITPGAAIAPRRLLRPVTIGGVEVSEGTVLAANVIGAHSRVETWTDPEVFRPERFLATSPAPGTFLPFGGGLRRCLGVGFAETEMPLVIAMLLRDWVLEPQDTTPRESMHGFLIGPTGHVWARVRNRHRSAS